MRIRFGNPQIIKGYQLFYILLLFVFLLCLSCRGNKAQKPEEGLEVTLEMLVHKNNSVQLFYVLKADDSYSEALSLREGLLASEKLQKIRFHLPAGVKAKNIRIDIGEHTNLNDSVRIESISFRYKNLIIDGSRGAYKSWFTLNKNVNPIGDGLTYRLVNSRGDFDPQLNGKRTLNARLVKLYPPNIYEK